MTAAPDPSDPPATSDRGYDPLLTILTFLSAVMLAVGVPAPAATDPAPPPPTRASIDPNRAPWWELTVLPQIGETLANEIIRYRKASRDYPSGSDGGPVFRRAADLAKVRGIGPKTVQRIAPHLWLDEGRQPAD